jgi:hypothetical protein
MKRAYEEIKMSTQPSTTRQKNDEFRVRQLLQRDILFSETIIDENANFLKNLPIIFSACKISKTISFNLSLFIEKDNFLSKKFLLKFLPFSNDVTDVLMSFVSGDNAENLHHDDGDCNNCKHCHYVLHSKNSSSLLNCSNEENCFTCYRALKKANVNINSKCLSCKRYTTHQNCKVKTRLCLECSNHKDRVVCVGCKEIFNSKHDVLIKCAENNCSEKLCATCVYSLKYTDQLSASCSSCGVVKCLGCYNKSTFRECVACEEKSCENCFLVCLSCGDNSVCTSCKISSRSKRNYCCE